METYQAVKGFLQKQLSYKSKLGGNLFLFWSMRWDLPFGFEGWAADQMGFSCQVLKFGRAQSFLIDQAFFHAWKRRWRRSGTLAPD